MASLLAALIEKRTAIGLSFNFRMNGFGLANRMAEKLEEGPLRFRCWFWHLLLFQRDDRFVQRHRVSGAPALPKDFDVTVPVAKVFSDLEKPITGWNLNSFARLIPDHQQAPTAGREDFPECPQTEEHVAEVFTDRAGVVPAPIFIF